MTIKRTREEREADRKERDENLCNFLSAFEKAFGYKPEWRRTKAGAFMFDENGDHQFICDSFLLGRYAHFLDKDGAQALNLSWFMH
jgi:hypothetical protein